MVTATSAPMANSVASWIGHPGRPPGAASRNSAAPGMREARPNGHSANAKAVKAP